MKYIKSQLRILLSTLILIFALGGQAIIPSSALACGTGTGSSQNQVINGVDQTGTDCTGSGVTGVISAAVNILSFIIGIAAVIMIIVSAYKYIVSGGEASKVASAKTTLIYALVGIAIAALAQLLVQFVLYQSTKA